MAIAVEGPAPSANSIPKARLIGLYVVSVSLGLVPFALTIKSWLVLPIAALTVAIVVTGTTRGINRYSGSEPTPAEIGLAMIGSLSRGLLCSVLGILVFLIVRGLFAIFDWLIFSQPLSTWTTVPETTWEKYLSLLVPGTLAWLGLLGNSLEEAPALLRKLYPDRLGERSPYFALSQQKKYLYLLFVQAAICVVVVVLIVALPSIAQFVRPPSALTQVVSYLGSILGLIVLSGYWLIFTQDLWDTSSPEAPRARNQPLVEKVQALMAAGGYEVRIYPKTGDAEADPLVALLDFVAIRSDRSVAGMIRNSADSRGFNREIASIRPSVWALEEQLSKGRSRKIVLEPVLFIVGRSPGVENYPYVAPHHVRVIPIAESEIDALLAGKDEPGGVDRVRKLIDPPALRAAPPPEAGLATT